MSELRSLITKKKKKGYNPFFHTRCIQAATPQRTSLITKEEGLHGAQATTLRQTPEKQKKAARSSSETGCHPKEANPKKASVRET
jgi:hypothetical protein